MTSVGTGVGGNVGGPSIPLQRDIEATAWTEVNKAALGIIADSIEKSFNEINPRYSTGYMGGFGYKTTAENPLLDHPLEAVRMSMAFNQATDEAWQLTYETLINQLPKDLLARLTTEGNKPFEQRRLSFVALDHLLLKTAKFLTQVQNLSQPWEIASLEETRTTLNILLPFAALKGAIANGNEIILAAQDFLINQGANYRYFDNFNSLLNDLQSPLALMEKVNQSLNHTEQGQLNPQARRAAEKAADQLATIASRLERISLGSDLQMMIATVKSLEMIATSLSLPNIQTAPLFLALSLASIGLYSSESPIGLLGPNYASLINQLSQGLISGLMPNHNKAGKELFTLTIIASLTAFISLASLAVNTGLGPYPVKDSKTLEDTHFFAFEAAIHLAVSSGFIETFYKEMIDAAGGDLTAQNLGSATLAQVAHFLMILSGSLTGNRTPQGLIESQADHLLKGIFTAEEIEKKAENDQTVVAGIALKLFTLSLEAHDYEGFLDAYHNLIENIGVSQDALKAEITTINTAGEAIAGLSTTENLDTHLTGIMHII